MSAPSVARGMIMKTLAVQVDHGLVVPFQRWKGTTTA